MDKAELAAIRARAGAATAGPWYWVEPADDPGWADHGPWLYAGDGDDARQILGSWGHDAWGLVIGTSFSGSINGPDAVFLAHARDDVTRLLGELGRLRVDIITYGRHGTACRYGYGSPCMCGWLEALQRAKGNSDATDA